jgi:hypothetical protein
LNSYTCLMQEKFRPPFACGRKTCAWAVNGRQARSESVQSAESRDSAVSAAKKQPKGRNQVIFFDLAVRQDVESSAPANAWKRISLRDDDPQAQFCLLGENQKRHRQSMREYAADAVILLPWLSEAYSMHKKYHTSGMSQRLIDCERECSVPLHGTRGMVDLVR